MKRRKRKDTFVLVAVMLFSVLTDECIGDGTPNCCRTAMRRSHKWGSDDMLVRFLRLLHILIIPHFFIF